MTQPPPQAPLALFRAGDRAADGSPSTRSNGIARKLARIRRVKQAPRTPDYMHALAREQAGEGVVIIERDDSRRGEALKEAQEVYLLWEDSIGFGWGMTELAVLAARGGFSGVTVLNGRRRRFSLTPGSLAAAWIRRFVERTYAGELVFTVLFVVVSPFLVSWDLLHGRK